MADGVERLILEQLEQLAPGEEAASGDWLDVLRRAEREPRRPGSWLRQLRVGASRRVRLGVLLGVLVAGVAVVALLIASASGNGPSLVERAQAALAPVRGSAVLHEQVVMEVRQGSAGGRLLSRSTSDAWVRSDGEFRAYVYSVPATYQGEIGGITAAEDGISEPDKPILAYDPSTNVLYESLDYYVPPNPIALVRKYLAEGRADADGTAVINGAAVDRIRVPLVLRGPAGPTGFVCRLETSYLFVDPHTYRPVEWSAFGFGASARSLVHFTFRFRIYRYLPATRANLRLASITAEHPSAKVVKLSWVPPRAPKAPPTTC